MEILIIWKIFKYILNLFVIGITTILMVILINMNPISSYNNLGTPKLKLFSSEFSGIFYTKIISLQFYKVPYVYNILILDVLRK